MQWSLISQRPEQALGEGQRSSDAQEERGGGAAFFLATEDKANKSQTQVLLA